MGSSSNDAGKNSGTHRLAIAAIRRTAQV